MNCNSAVISNCVTGDHMELRDKYDISRILGPDYMANQMVVTPCDANSLRESAKKIVNLQRSSIRKNKEIKKTGMLMQIINMIANIFRPRVGIESTK